MRFLAAFRSHLAPVWTGFAHVRVRCYLPPPPSVGTCSSRSATSSWKCLGDTTGRRVPARPPSPFSALSLKLPPLPIFPAPQKPFEMQAAWEARLRKYYGEVCPRTPDPSLPLPHPSFNQPAPARAGASAADSPPCVVVFLSRPSRPTQRYDNIKNVVDWDYHMRLAEAGATIVHFIQFRDWRITGLGYELGDCVYQVISPPLAS